VADLTDKTPGEILADASVAEFISKLGLGIADAQTALDNNSLRQIEAFTTRRDDLGGRSLLDMGLSPAFYHYQHADISCSLQVRLEVGRSSEFGFATQVDFTRERNTASTDALTETESESGSRTEVKRARLAMRADSQGALVLDGGRSFSPTGDDPAARLTDLRALLTQDASTGIDALIEMPPPGTPDMALDTPSAQVTVTSPTIAFHRPDFDNAALRIRVNEATDFVVDGGLTVSVGAQADLDAYVDAVVAAFEAEGFGASVISPGTSALDASAPQYDTGASDLRPDDALHLAKLGDILRQTGISVRLEGFTDRQGAATKNVALGTARAEKLKAHLVAQGVTPGQITVTQSRGEAQHATDDRTGPEDNPDYRKTTITLVNLDYHLVTIGNGPDIDPAAITPDGIGNPGGAGNAYVALYDQVSLMDTLSNNAITIDGEEFTFLGTANGGASGAAQSLAANLAAKINADSSTLTAWASGNVVRVARNGDSFDIQLFTRDDREIRIEEQSDFAITEQFSRTRRRVATSNTGGKNTLAVGVSIDGRTSRQYNLEVTGNSTISARLVSVPAPVEFLDEIRAYQNELDG